MRLNIINLLHIILVIKSASSAVSYNTTYNFDASATVLNPLKGFVPYYWEGMNS